MSEDKRSYNRTLAVQAAKQMVMDIIDLYPDFFAADMADDDALRLNLEDFKEYLDEKLEASMEMVALSVEALMDKDHWPFIIAAMHLSELHRDPVLSYVKEDDGYEPPVADGSSHNLSHHFTQLGLYLSNAALPAMERNDVKNIAMKAHQATSFYRPN